MASARENSMQLRRLLRTLRSSAEAWAVLNADGRIDPRTVTDARGEAETRALNRKGAKLVRVLVTVKAEAAHG